MADKVEKQIAISLLLTSMGEKYWDKPPKERLKKVEAIIVWLNMRLPYFC